MIEEDYVSFETAKLMKEKGFQQLKDNCRYFTTEMIYSINVDDNGEHYFVHQYPAGVYNNDEYIAAPTLQMAMKWLREVSNIDVDIDAAVGMLGVKVYVPFIITYKQLEDVQSKVLHIKRGIYYKDDKGVIPALQHFDSYEQACEAAIKYCLENLI